MKNKAFALQAVSPCLDVVSKTPEYQLLPVLSSKYDGKMKKNDVILLSDFNCN